MTNTNATQLRQNLFKYLNQAILHNDVININTKNGNAVILSEEDYAGLLETIYLTTNKKTYEQIVDAASAKRSDFMTESEAGL